MQVVSKELTLALKGVGGEAGPIPGQVQSPSSKHWLLWSSRSSSRVLPKKGKRHGHRRVNSPLCPGKQSCAGFALPLTDQPLLVDSTLWPAVTNS